MMKIVIFTDCMSIGPNYVNDELRYPGIIQEMVLDDEIIVKGASGATTKDSLLVLDEIIKMKPDIVIYGYGINDALPRGLHRHQRAYLIRCMYKLKFPPKTRLFLRRFFLNPLEYILQFFLKPKHYYEISETRKNIEVCIDKVIENHAKAIVLGINPVSNYRFVNSSHYISKYNDTIRELCVEKNVEFINVFEHFMENDVESVLAEDKFHYGHTGHRIVANELIKVILRK